MPETPWILQPTDTSQSDRKTIQKINELFSEASKFRKRFEEDWKTYEAFYDGRHWPFGEQKPVNNWCFSIIESEVPVLVDSKPGTDVVAIEEENLDKARVLKESIDFVYQQNSIDIKLSQAVRTALKVGTGMLYVDFDPDLEQGKGQIIVKNLPWRFVYFDPAASHIDEMSYLIIKLPMRVDDLRRLYPKFSDKIKEEDVDLDDVTKSDIFRNEHRYSPPSTGDISYGDSFKFDNMAYFWEVWRKDYTMEKIPKDESMEEAQKEFEMLQQGIIPDISKHLDHEVIISYLQSQRVSFISNFLQVPPQEIIFPMAEPIASQPEIANFMTMLDDLVEQHVAMLDINPKGERPKYKNNLRLTLIASNTVLYDDEAPVDDGMYPLVPVYSYKQEESVYGFGEIKNIISPQRVYDELHMAEYKSLRLNTNAGWVKDDTSQVDENSLTNEEGLVITKKQGTDVHRLDPGTVSPQLTAKQQELLANIEAISGINEATQGRRPRGVTAARAIEFLQQQAVGRIRLKSNMLEEFTMLRMGKLVASRILKYWTTTRILKVFDNNGQITSDIFNPDEMADLKYQVRVSPGSTFGLSKEVILEQTQQLLAQGVLDAETFVILNDLPFKNTILSKIQERDQLRAQAESLAIENEQLKQQLGSLAPAGATSTQTPGSPNLGVVAGMGA